MAVTGANFQIRDDSTSPIRTGWYGQWTQIEHCSAEIIRNVVPDMVAVLGGSPNLKPRCLRE